MPLLALHRRFVLGNDKMATAPDLSLRGAKRRGALSAKREEVPLGCNLLQQLANSPRPSCYLPLYCEIATSACGLLAMTNRRLLPFYRYPIRIGGAAPGAACRSPTAHGRRSVYFSFFIFQSSVFISMRPSPTTHYRFLASGVDFSCASCSARMMRFETSQPRGVRYQREPLCAARPCAAKRSSSCCSGAKGSR